MCGVLPIVSRIVVAFIAILQVLRAARRDRGKEHRA
jgi:hypothetical protein